MIFGHFMQMPIDF